MRLLGLYSHKEASACLMVDNVLLVGKWVDVRSSPSASGGRDVAAQPALV